MYQMFFSERWQKWVVFYQTIWGQTKLVSTHDSESDAQDVVRSENGE